MMKLSLLLAMTIVFAACSTIPNHPGGERGVASTSSPEVYVDKTFKLGWSRVQTGTYTNGCMVPSQQNVSYDTCSADETLKSGKSVTSPDSKAAAACAAINARLPQKFEFEGLIRSLDHTEEYFGPKLTRAGVDQLYPIFGDMNSLSDGGLFWTSTIDPQNDLMAFYFSSAFGQIGYPDSFNGGKIVSTLIRSSQMGVICVFDHKQSQ